MPRGDRRTLINALRFVVLAALLLVAPTDVVSPASAITCNPAAATPTNSDPGSVVLADNFESGTFGKWTTVVDDGDAWAGISGAHRVSGWCAGRLWVTPNSGSRAYVQK